MKGKILFASFVFTLCFVSVFSGARRDQSSSDISAVKTVEKPELIRASALNGPSGVGMAYLFDGEKTLDGVKLSMEIAASPDVLLPKLLKGEVDMGILPVNVAAKVYTKNNNQVIIGAVVGNGMLNCITEDVSVNSIHDLKGKTLYVAGQGSTPEYMIRYLAQKSGIEVNTSSASSITLDFSIPAAEIAAALVSGKIQYAFVPEPFATVAQINKASVRRAFDVQKLYAQVSGNTEFYPMTVLVIRKEFAEKYPHYVSLFLDEYRASIERVNADPKAAGLVVEQYSLGLKAPVVAKSVPSSAFVFTPAKEAVSDVEKLLSIFLEFAPDSVGGVLPGEGFYFK